MPKLAPNEFSMQRYVRLMSEDERIQIVRDWMIFEARGQIGTSVLRTQAENAIELLKAPRASVTHWMSSIAMEVFKQYALKYLQESDS